MSSLLSLQFQPAIVSRKTVAGFATRTLAYWFVCGECATAGSNRGVKCSEASAPPFVANKNKCLKNSTYPSPMIHFLPVCRDSCGAFRLH